MKLTKTRIQSRLGEDTVDQTLRPCIEGPPTLSDEDIDSVMRNLKQHNLDETEVCGCVGVGVGVCV